MAATTTKPPPPPPAAMILINSIDMSSLTQSELHSLSLLSNNTTTTPFSHHPKNDTVSSNPNNTNNNESPSLSPLKRRRHGHGHGHDPLSLLKRERHESTLIVSFLKQYLHAPHPPRVPHASSVEIVEQERENDAVGGGERMRKRRRENVVPRVVVMSLPAEERENYGGAWVQLEDCATGRKRKRKRREKVAELRECVTAKERKQRREKATSVEIAKCDGERKKPKRRENEARRVDIVNRDGVVVDVAALAARDDEEREKRGGRGGGGPFGEELRRRAGGREREEELLKMMGEMEGEWCSQRKKRRVVRACLLGNALPVGWKLIIALRRRAGRFSPYCRRYVRFVFDSS